MMKEKQNCFTFLKNQFLFFHSLSAGNRNATPTVTLKRTHPVEGTSPEDNSLSVKVILSEMQGRKISMQIFVNLKHYFEFNCNVFNFVETDYCSS